LPAQSLRPGRHSPGRISVGRGRDSVYPGPPAQIPACGTTASVNARKATVQADSLQREKNAIMLDPPDVSLCGARFEALRENWAIERSFGMQTATRRSPSSVEARSPMAFGTRRQNGIRCLFSDRALSSSMCADYPCNAPDSCRVTSPCTPGDVPANGESERAGVSE